MARRFFRYGRAYGGYYPASASMVTCVPDGTITTSTNMQGAMDQIIAALTNSKVSTEISNIEVDTNPLTNKKGIKVTYTDSGVTLTGRIDFQ